MFNIDSLVHDGERFVVPLGPNFGGASRFASFSSVDGTEWDVTPTADPEFSPQQINTSVDRVGEWNVFVPFAPFELVDEPLAYISDDTTTWEALPFTPPDEPIDETLKWNNFATIWPDADAFMLGLHPGVDAEKIDFEGVVFGCVAPCRDRYVSVDDDREIVFTTDLGSSHERFFFADDDELTEVLGPAFTTRYLLRTSTWPLAIERKILGEHKAAQLINGRWESVVFTPPPGNLFMMRSHRGRFYAFALQLGDIFELFVSDDEATTWQSIATFDRDAIDAFGPALDFVGGADQRVAIALGGNPSQIIYAENGIDFESIVEHPWPDEPIGITDLAISDDQLGYLSGSPSQAAFLDLP